MIVDIRYLERRVPAPQYGEGYTEIGKVLQIRQGMHDDDYGPWEDVRTEREGD